MTIPYQLHNKIRKLSSSPLVENRDYFSLFLEKPFWIWDKAKHRAQFLKTNGTCCFNHIIGLPIKNDKQYPIFDFQKLIFDTIEQNQNIWIKKSRGIGVTTFIIRYLTWKVLNSSELDNKTIFIISGTIEEFANYVKEKMQQLFTRKFPFVKLESKYTELWLKNTWIKVMPTRNIKDVRGYFDASYLFIDEADFFDKSIQEELEPAIMAYEEKSKGKTIMVSTPNAPDGLFERIEKDVNSKYYKLKLDYTYGLDKIYDRAFIEKKKLEPEFEREYNLKYLGKIGNLFSALQIDAAIESGSELNDIPVSQYTLKCVGIDVGFSSSKTAIVLTEHLKDQDKIIVRYSEEFDKGDPNAICDLLFNFHRQYWNLYFLIDGSNRAMVNLLKIKFDESLTWEPDDVSPESMRVLPVNFSTDHKSMLSHLHLIVSKGYVAIPEKHDKLIASLRTAYAKELTLDKEQTSYDDLLDALRLSVKGYNIK